MQIKHTFNTTFTQYKQLQYLLDNDGVPSEEIPEKVVTFYNRRIHIYRPNVRLEFKEIPFNKFNAKPIDSTPENRLVTLHIYGE